MGVQILAVTTDPLGDLRNAADENNISTIPMLSDADTGVSRAYDALGRGMHADTPGHTFVLIDKRGIIRWRQDYSEMYVPDSDILDAVQQALKQAPG